MRMWFLLVACLLAASGCAGGTPAADASRADAPREPDWSRVPIGDVFVRRGETAALGWLELRVRGMRACGKGTVGIEIEMANKSDVAIDWYMLRPTLYARNGTELEDAYDYVACPPKTDEIPSGGSGMRWLVFAGQPRGVDLLQLSFLEPRGLGSYRVLLALRDDTKAPALKQPPARAFRDAPARLQAGPVESRFYRVAVTDMRVCRAPKGDEDIEVGIELLIDNRSNIDFRLDYRPALRDAKGYSYEPRLMLSYGREPDRCGDKLPTAVAAGERVRGWVKSFLLPRHLFAPSAGAPALHYSLTGKHYEPVKLRLDVGKLPAVKIPPPPPAPPKPETAPTRWLQAATRSVEAQKVRITVTNVQPCRSEIDDGIIAVGVEVLIENRGDTPIYLPWAGRIEDDKAYRYGLSDSYHDEPPCLPTLDTTQPLKPGEKIRGWLNHFALPLSARGLKLRYSFQFAERDENGAVESWSSNQNVDLIVAAGHLEK